MRKKGQTDWEAVLAFQLRAAKIPFDRQYKDDAIRSSKRDRYKNGRHYPFDFRVGDVLVEVQGGLWRGKGAHNTGLAITRDCEKQSLAAVAGYRVICVTPEQIKKGLALEWIEDALK